jgi:hypothetical protein
MERSFGVAPPRLGPPLVLTVLSAALALAAGLLTAAAITGRLPAWCDPTHVVPLRSLGVEILVASIGLINFAGAVLATLAFAGRARRLLQFRWGRIPVEEFEGPCLLVEEGQGIWSFRLELVPEPAEIAFYLDEGTAACISRMFHPWEVLRLSWLDLPLSSGGPALLEVRDAHEAAAAEEPPEALAA